MTNEVIHQKLNDYLNNRERLGANHTPTYSDVCDWLINLITSTPEVTRDVAVANLKLKLSVVDLDVKNLLKKVSDLQLESAGYRTQLAKIGEMARFD